MSSEDLAKLERMAAGDGVQLVDNKVLRALVAKARKAERAPA